MKIIVTHCSPDLDAITSCWLIKRFLRGWSTAKIKFVPAGSTLDNKPPDDNPDIIHVDTGLGRFDHHQTARFTCAAKRVFKYLLEKGCLRRQYIKPLRSIVKFANAIDHFQDVYFPDATSYIYDFLLHQIVEGLRSVLNNDAKLVEFSLIVLDGVLQLFKSKEIAERDLKKGTIFNSRWGRSLAVKSCSEEAMKMALKGKFNLVVRKDPKNGYVRIKTRPSKALDLTPLYQKIKSIDKKGSWFLHVSKNMLLNGSSKNSGFTPTPLTLKELTEIIKGI